MLCMFFLSFLPLTLLQNRKIGKEGVSAYVVFGGYVMHRYLSTQSMNDDLEGYADAI